MYSDRTSYPLMAVGFFNIMFWIGFVVGHNIGLACDGMLLCGIGFGAAGCYSIVKLERISKGVSRSSAARQKPAGSKNMPVSRVNADTALQN